MWPLGSIAIVLASGRTQAASAKRRRAAAYRMYWFPTEKTSELDFNLTKFILEIANLLYGR
jgi:hypothetical protein